MSIGEGRPVKRRLQSLMARARKRPGRAVGVIVLCLLIGFGLMIAGANYWAWHEYAAAEQAIVDGNYEEARKHLNGCLRFWATNGQVQYWMARTERCLGNFDEASSRLDICDDLGWSDAGIALERILLRAQQGEFPEVESQLRRWASKDAADAAAILEVLVEQYYARSFFSAANKYGEKFLAHFPNHIRALRYMGLCYSAQNNFADAIKCLTKAVALQPENPESRKALAEALLLSNRPREALVHYRRLARDNPSSMDFALRVVRCHRSLGDLDQCKLLMGKLIEQFPRNWEVMSEMGRLAWTRQDAAEAEKWWRRAVDLNPYDKQTLHDLYICLNQTKGPNDPAVRKVKEQFDRIARDYARFEDLMLRQLPANPNNPDIHYEIGSLFFRLGEEKSGAFWMQKTLALNPQHRAAHLTLASYLDKTGNKEQAENERRLASGMSPSAH